MIRAGLECEPIGLAVRGECERAIPEPTVVVVAQQIGQFGGSSIVNRARFWLHRKLPGSERRGIDVIPRALLDGQRDLASEFYLLRGLWERRCFRRNVRAGGAARREKQSLRNDEKRDSDWMSG